MCAIARTDAPEALAHARVALAPWFAATALQRFLKLEVCDHALYAICDLEVPAACVEGFRDAMVALGWPPELRLKLNTSHARATVLLA